MEDIHEHTSQARRLTQAEYARNHAGFFFLGKVPEDWDDELSYNTQVRTISNVDETLSHSSDEMKPGNFLARIEKSSRASWLSWISLGRARNNDIILRHSSISKLHAQIHTERDEESSEERFFISDAGSANGTWVNGKTLKTGAPVLLHAGDKVTIGDIESTFLDAQSLYGYLRRLSLISYARF